MRHAHALQPEPQVERGEMRRIGHRADERDMRVADLHVGLHRERALRVLHGEHAADLPFARDGGLVVGALHRPADAVRRHRRLRPVLGRDAGIRRRARGIRGRAARRGRGGRSRSRRCLRRRFRFRLLAELARPALADHLRRRFARRLFLLLHHLADRHGLAERIDDGLHVGLRDFIGKGDIALRERDVVQLQVPGGRFGRLLELERPVVAIVLEPFQIDRRIDQVDARNHDVVSEERQQRDLEIDLVERGEERLFRPLGIRHRDLFRGKARPWHPALPAGFRRRPLPAELEVAGDVKLPADGLRHLVVDPRAGAVPVEGQENDHEHSDQHRE